MAFFLGLLRLVSINNTFPGEEKYMTKFQGPHGVFLLLLKLAGIVCVFH